jgi:hypothetical protein
MDSTEPNPSTSESKISNRNALVLTLLERVGGSIIVIHGPFFALVQYGRQRGNIAYNSNAKCTSDLPFRISNE